MAAKKRTTKEEKFNILLSLFKETEDVYQLKDVERVASKEKGLAPNVIKETLQRLVDDGQVEEGKIGNQIYYWRFESKALQDKKEEFDALKEKLTARENYLKELELKLSKINPSDYENIDDDVKANQDLKNKIASIEEEIKSNSKNNDTEEVVKELNEWTDNIFLIKKFVRKKMNMDDKQMDKQYKIPDDLDYM